MSESFLRPVEAGLEPPPAGSAGRARYTQLEYEALLANASIGIAFTRERHFFLCNPKFAEMFGWDPEELIGQPGEVVYPGRESYAALGKIAVPILAAGRQLDLEWKMRRKDGSTFLARMIAKAIDDKNPQQGGTVWIVEDITEQRRAEDELQRVLAEQQALLDNVSVGIAFRRDRKTVRANRRYEEMFGYGPGEAIGTSTRDIYFTDEEFSQAARVYPELDEGRTLVREQWLRRKDGSGFWCRMTGRAVKPGDPARGYVWLVVDITQEREAEERLQRAAAEQELIFDNATVGIAFVRNRVIQRCNRYLEDMVGAGPGELLGESSAVLFHDEQEWRQAGRLAYESTAPGERHDSEWRFKRRDGSTFPCRTRGRRIDAGEPEQEWIWSFEDVTAEREADSRVQRALDELERVVAERTAELRDAQARAQHLADHDALTGLPNRRLLEDRLTQALALGQRNRQRTAVMFVDLDRFKTINDSLGHAVGDALLKEVAGRLMAQLRVGDTICRIGGDEFVLVLPEIKRSSDVAHIAQKVIDQLSAPMTIEERELIVTPSIGIAVFPDDGRDAETLIRNADAAMYHAKELGRANYQFFTEQMNLAASRRLALESDLRRALGRGELRVHYQRIAETGSGRVAGHEALVRWQHPQRGLVMPSGFIQLAEETGQILKIGEWVLQEACRWNTFIGGRSHEGGELQVTVNLSPRQFNDPRLPELVARALRDTGLPARLLELEITESTAMRETDATLGTLRRLKQLGVSIAIDDFGTGYSSLAYLKRFPVDKVKIDRTFVADVPGDRDQCAIVSAIVALARALGIRVIAEGVETEAQRAFLQRCGCDFVQGYLTGAPQDAEAAAREYV
ncbi:MAG TPA: EAL domain-containing protein [Burkholderiales bacterium]|nr:EAL domain-containing protein [Burkholderiales bacterium]